MNNGEPRFKPTQAQTDAVKRGAAICSIEGDQEAADCILALTAAAGEGREKLTSDVTYYVGTDGDATIEECAKVADKYFNDPGQYVSRKIAAEIRAKKGKP